MKFLILIYVTLMVSSAALGNIWCYANSASHPAEKFLESGVDIEAAKNAARLACADTYPDCEISDCYVASPYAFSCVATHPTGEKKIGGHQAYSFSYDLAKIKALGWCMAVHPDCAVACYPNFQPADLAYSKNK